MPDLPELAGDEAGEALRLRGARPETIGPWLLLRPLAASRRSLVYVDQHETNQSLCALKILPPGEEATQARWSDEVEALKALEHTPER
ncbi:MAG: hypothetical protein MK101_04480 [Phycisphaerales bacterium]|nr:hypothetical protein [Phycisphaerales bacterium]